VLYKEIKNFVYNILNYKNYIFRNHMADEETVYFDNKVAHYFILGCALFSIFWGVINAVLVKNVKISDKEENNDW